MSNHFYNVESSHSTFSHSCSKFFPEQSRLISSAKRIQFRCFSVLQMSFMYVINSFGPKTDPCGTPWVNFLISELLYERIGVCLRASSSATPKLIPSHHISPFFNN